VLWLGCGGASSRPSFPTPDDAEAGPRRGPAHPAADGRLRRADLARALAAGPGAFLGSVSVRAAREGGHFVGWEVLALDPSYAAAGVRVGDVVRRVNGLPLERPDDLTALFRALGAPDVEALELDVRRGGADEVVRVPVLE
jgi:type II secretory pathway component PulC